MLRELRRNLKTRPFVFSIPVLLFCSIVLSGCGGEEAETVPEKRTAEAAKYGDIVSDIKFIFDSPEEHEAFLGLQYYHGEAVQLLSTEDGSLCLLKADKSREILAGGADLAGMACFLDIEGNCYYWETDSAAQPVSIRKSDADGNQLYSVSAGDGMQVSDICQMEDGRIYLLLENTGTGNVSLSELNSKTGVLSKVTDISLSSNGVNTARYIAPGSEGILVIEAGATEKITEVNLKDGTREDVLSFVGTTYNLGRNKVGNMTARDFRVLEDGSVELLWADARGICLRESLSMSLTDKIAILLRMGYEDSWLKDRVFQFNQENPDYHVVLDSPGTGDAAAYRDMTQVELGTGKGPDILSGYLVYELRGLAAERFFEDLMPYMEASGIREEDYFPAAFGYIRDEEKVYTVVTEMTVEAGWLSEEVLAGDELPGIEELVDALLGWRGSYGYTTGVAYRKILEACSRVREGADSENSANHSVFYGCRIESPWDVTRRSMYGLDLWDYADRIVGYPGMHGSEHKFYPDSVFAMNSASKNKDGAWDFLEFMMSEEMQSLTSWGLPSRKDVFEQSMSDIYVSPSRANSFPLYDESGQLLLPGMVKEVTAHEIEVLRGIVENAKYDSWGGSVSPLWRIVSNEAEMYFKGDAGLDSTIDKIQNRVQLYLDESK